MNNKRLPIGLTFVIVGILGLPWLGIDKSYASVEGMLGWTEFNVVSEGIGESGPVKISGKQNSSGVTELKIWAFGRTYEPTKEQYATLKTFFVNGMQLSYEGGYAIHGGRTLYLQLSRGFTSGIKGIRLITLNERGEIRIEDQPAK